MKSNSKQQLKLERVIYGEEALNSK